MIKFPYIGVCKMNLQNNFCIGCGRSINQITNWSLYTEKKQNNRKY